MSRSVLPRGIPVVVATVVTTLAVPLGGAVQPERPAPFSPAQRLVVPLSDPSRPGTVKVRAIQASVTVRAGSGRDVIVTTSGARRERPDGDRDRPRDTGLRRLNQPLGVDIEEDGNVVTVSTPTRGRGALVLEVPTRTHLQVSAVNGGQVTIEGVDGDIEVNHVNGSVTLNDVAGSVVSHSVNGSVRATILRLGTSPMAFTSMNGEVVVTLPPTAKANLKLRSDRGDVLTDFDVQPTAPPARADASRTRPRPDDRRAARRRLRDTPDRDTRDGLRRLELDSAIYGTVNGGGIEIELRSFNGDVRLQKGK